VNPETRKLDQAEKWDLRYREGHRGKVSPFLAQVAERIPPGRALDVATGSGANALFLARRGFEVEAFDLSAEAIRLAREAAEAEGLKVSFHQADAASFPVEEEAYDLILMIRFLDRNLIPRLKKGLKKGGKVVVETFNVRHLSRQPTFNPHYLLGINELLHLFYDLDVLFFREEDHLSQLLAERRK
jgi:2-polyprenyl-3-methyl-5-hydroxy-6-metoxy-1,4-benzoquinol methylase